MSDCRGRIAILRQPDRAEPLRVALVEAGFEVVVRPVTREEYIAPRAGEDWPARVAHADWVVFTSLNGVRSFAKGVGGAEALAELLTGRRVAALGATSGEELEALGVRPEVLEEHGTSRALVSALLAVMEPEAMVLYPRAERTMPTLPRALSEAGHHLKQVVCYRTIPLSPEERAPLDWSALDAAVVAAPSAVHALHDEGSLPADFGFFAIGPTTAEALGEAGRRVLGAAESPKVGSIVEMLIDWLEDRTHYA